VHTLVNRPAGMGIAPKGDMHPEINVKKKVDRSLEKDDPRFAPKVRTY